MTDESSFGGTSTFSSFCRCSAKSKAKAYKLVQRRTSRQGHSTAVWYSCPWCLQLGRACRVAHRSNVGAPPRDSIDARHCRLYAAITSLMMRSALQRSAAALLQTLTATAPQPARQLLPALAATSASAFSTSTAPQAKHDARTQRGKVGSLPDPCASPLSASESVLLLWALHRAFVDIK
jgi:hypothetical protein